MKRLLTAALGVLLLSCQGPAAVLAQEADPHAEARHPATGSNWEGVGVRPEVVVPADRALEEALRLAGG